MAEHILTITAEASGEVTRAPQPQPDQEAIEPSTDEELNTDG
ncbi:hypothetical protein [Streptomyces sp. NPDC003832]